MLKKLVLANRSYRRFDSQTSVTMSDLEDLVALARLCPSAANKQTLRFVLSTNTQDNEDIFSCLKWAAYLKDWDGPVETERPSAYIIMVNTAQEWDFAKYDQGIMAQTMLLGAVEKGLGGCIIASIDRQQLAQKLDLENYNICLVIALGKPVEEVRIVNLPQDGSIKYYRDSQKIHYVPKRSLEELILQKRA